MEEVVEKVIEFSGEDTMQGYFTKEKLVKTQLKDKYEKGLEQGKAEIQKEIILALKEKLSLEDLSEATGLMVEEVKKIIEGK